MLIKLQPAPHTDQVLGDGTELTQLPYPFYVTEDGTGHVGSQEFRAVGFQKDLARHRIDLHWVDVVKDPQLAVGKYLVTQDKGGGWAVNMSAIDHVEVLDP